ncbi:MAG: MazG nucleotide pyrophosphohydrolase domain-containing protein [Armatimonadota bacterium]|jgi:NTP pyrophosphatase (non-canonical NTP hydrolase)
MTIEQFQQTIDETYGERDARRGLESTFMWLVEEVGELARALRNESHERKVEEFADVLAWLTTTASLAGVDMSEAAERFAAGCPKCEQLPCGCGRRRT